VNFFPKRSKLYIKRKNSRANIKIHKLQNELNDIKVEMSKMSQDTLNEILLKSKIPDSQVMIVKEIFSAAKFKNSKSRRYSENWMLSCLLFQIR